MPGNLGSADVVINKVSSPRRATAGALLSYFIEVYNCGPDPAPGVDVTDSLPSGTFFVSSSQVEGVSKFIISNPPVGSEGGDWSATLDEMAVGESARFEIIVRVAP
ncbi:MAG: DUF11 domain-containing protein [Acidobacteriota bacterium]